MGMENLLMAIAAEPELVTGVGRHVVEINLRWRRKCGRGGWRSCTRATTMPPSTGPLCRHVTSANYSTRPVRVMGGFKETRA